MFKILLLGLSLSLSSLSLGKDKSLVKPSGGGANVAFHISPESLSVSDRAANHPGFSSVEIRGKINLSDAVIAGFKGGAVGRFVLLFDASKPKELLLAKNCIEFAKSGSELRIDVFMDNVNTLPGKVEGGNADEQFNAYTIALNDSDIDRVTCIHHVNKN